MSGMSFGPGYRISSVVKDSNKDEWHAVSSHGPERAHHLLMLDGSKCEIEFKRGYEKMAVVMLVLKREFKSKMNNRLHRN